MKKLLSLAALFVVILSANAAPEKGFFGFKISAETSGFVLNPTVKKVTIDSVLPDSPASGRIAAGDEIVEAEGHAVVGAKAIQLKPIMQKSPGETIHLKLKRASGESYSVDLTAIKRPG